MTEQRQDKISRDCLRIDILNSPCLFYVQKNLICRFESADEISGMGLFNGHSGHNEIKMILLGVKLLHEFVEVAESH